jgi:hypothetical protein
MNTPGSRQILAALWQAPISQRMARCRQLPVKQRDDARFGLVEHESADAIVAMHKAGGIVGGNVPGQPGDLFPVDERPIFNETTADHRTDRTDLRRSGAASMR